MRAIRPLYIVNCHKTSPSTTPEAISNIFLLLFLFQRCFILFEIFVSFILFIMSAQVSRVYMTMILIQVFL